MEEKEEEKERGKKEEEDVDLGRLGRSQERFREKGGPEDFPSYLGREAPELLSCRSTRRQSFSASESYEDRLLSHTILPLT